MTYYVAILSQSIVGEWHVQFPDVPGCGAYGFTVTDATFAAATALANRAENSVALPLPRELTEIEQDEEWLRRNGVDLSRIVVAMVPGPAQLEDASKPADDPLPDVVGRGGEAIFVR
jgi:predicted RNase H-like HicB family nuclease